MPKQYYSFLIINPFGIGDVLFSTPLIRNLKSTYPQSRIFYLCNKRTAALLQHHPFITGIFTYERDEFEAMRRSSLLQWIKMYRSFIWSIKKERIDVAIDLSLNAHFGFFALCAGIPKRVGLNFKNRGRFLTHKHAIDGFLTKHVVDYYLDTLTLLDIPVQEYPLEIAIAEEASRWAHSFILENKLQGQRIIGIAPCGGQAFGEYASIKRWPLEKFAEVTEKLIANCDATIFLFAGKNEKKEINELLARIGDARKHCFEFTDASLTHLVALIDHCALLVTNDTGPLRFADALGKKIVALFGPVDEKVYGPYPLNVHRTIVISHDTPCRPCYKQFRLSLCTNEKRCLKDISVKEVFQAVRKMLKDDVH